MNDVFDIEGYFTSQEKVVGTIKLGDLKLYINIPSWIEERNVYNVNTKEIIATIKPKKFGGLTYYIYDIVDEYAKIKTVSFGLCLVKITESTTLTNKPLYESGCY